MKKSILLIGGLLPALMCVYSQNPEQGRVIVVGAESFAEIINNGDIIVIDVRTTGEWSGGHIPGSANIDVNSGDFIEQVEGLCPPGKSLAVYCKSGIRGMKAAVALKERGYTVYNLEKGLPQWKGEIEER